MRSEQKDALYLTLIIIMVLLIGFFIGMGIAEGSSEKPPKLSQMVTVQRNSYVGIVSPFYVKPLLEANLVACLIDKESNGDPKAYNPRDIDGRPKHGILQFDSQTFADFCVKRYGLEDDIWDPEIQKECCGLMIKGGYGWHWGTWDQCSNVLGKTNQFKSLTNN